MEENFGKGAVHDKVDLRDYKWSDIGAASMPFDWNVGYDIETSGAIPSKNQGNSYSCGGQAWSYYMAVLKGGDERSAKFIYSQTFAAGGGSSGRDNSNIVIKQGDSKESLCTSYENGATPSEAFMQRPQDITPEAKADATNDKALSYAMVNASIDDVAQAIRDNKGCIVLIHGQNNGTWTTAFPLAPDPANGNQLWSHWLYCGKAKMIDGKKYIGAKNSWGDVGENGWQWLSEDHFKGAIQYGWTIAPVPDAPVGFTFKKDLSFSMTDPDILHLQVYLNNHGFPVALSGAGSSGQETNHFGYMTKKAVIKLQTANNINPTLGFVGPLTRAYLNSHQ